MSAGFTKTQIEALATLARLELSDAEVQTLSRQLGNILDYARQVQGIDTDGVPATASVVTGHAVDREDRARPSLERADALANAPDPANDAGLFRVPRVI